MVEHDFNDTGLIIDMIDPVDLSHPRISEFHTYWTSRHKENGDLPGLSDIDLMEIYKLAPWIAIVDVVPGVNPAIQFRWRFVGTQLCDALFMTNLTGHYLHDLGTASWTETIKNCYENIVSTPEPHMWHCRGTTYADSDEAINYTRLLLPLSDSDGGVGHLTSIYVPDDPDDEP